MNFTCFQFLQNLELREDIKDNKHEEQFFDYKLNLHVGHLQFVALGKFYWELNVSFHTSYLCFINTI